MGPIKKNYIRTENLGSNALYMKQHFILASKNKIVYMEMHIDLLILLVVQLMVIKIQRTFNICHENKYIYRFKKKKKNLGNVKMPTVTQHWKDFLQQLNDA